MRNTALTAREESSVSASEPVVVSEPPMSVSGAPSEPSSGETATIAEEEEQEPVDHNWPLDAPESHGMDGARLEALHGAIAGTGMHAVVIVKDGYLVDEYYKEGYDENSVFRLNSCTKSFTSALIGIAIEEALLEGVEVKLSEFFPQVAGSDSVYKREITVEHLLEHTSGIDWYEWGSGPMFRQLTQSENWVDFVLARPMAAEPGSTFNYSTGGSHLLAAVLELASGESAGEFARERLFRPLGMESVKWRLDPQGVTDGGNGIEMSARDAAKFGQLYLDSGNWKGRQIVPEAWVEQSTTYQSAGSYGTGQYGYQWWLKTFGEYSAYYAMGYAGQYIFVVPELRLVTVMTGRFQDTYAPQSYFSDYILAACA